MPTTTKKLKLFKYNPETDGKQTFNIQKALNDNFDKLDNFANNVDTNFALKTELPTKVSELINDNDYITTAKTLEKLSVQNMYLTGSITTEKQGFTQLQQMRRSTFDKSKFTVVGSPTITDDGVASGFGSSNYLSCDNISVNGNNWECTLDTIIYGDGIIVGTSITEEIARKTFEVAVYGNRLWLYIGDNTNKQQFSCLGITPNTRHIIKVGRLNGNYYIKIYNSSKTLINSSELPVTYEVNFISSLYFGVSNYSAFNGSINLPHFSITVYGKEVFNGNKTGIDNIKADDYKVVGNPTITDDGVASGFSSVNYINSDLSLNPTSKLVVKSRAVFDNSNARAQIIFRLYNPAVCRITANHNGFQMWCNNGFSSLTKTLNNGDIIDIEAIYETNKQTYYITVNGVTTQVNGAITCSLANLNLTKVVLGVYSANDVNYYFNGSIDLNALKIYVDGNLVYQPCLKIPYTQSKTGSKIVDVAYRDRVIDLYEQEGQAGYYTIDEENKNFTLPMGEIYGMIENRLNVSTATQTEKNAIIEWVMPDYSKATSVSYSSGDTIGFNGYLAITGYWMNKDKIASLYINNCLIMQQSSANDNGHSQQNHNSIMVSVSDTDVITWTNYTTDSLTFSYVPFKGGN